MWRLFQTTQHSGRGYSVTIVDISRQINSPTHSSYFLSRRRVLPCRAFTHQLTQVQNVNILAIN